MFLLAAAGAAYAADPLGEWKVEEDKATIRIVDCNSRLWGVIASEQIPAHRDHAVDVGPATSTARTPTRPSGRAPPWESLFF